MARIFKDSSVLNQFGSPSLNSNTLANRPAFGQVGRLFVDTTNNVIYRDTGTSWVLVGGAGSTPNLQAVTGVGNTSSNGIFLGLTGSLDSGLIFEVSGYTRMDQTVASATNLGASNIKQFTFQTSGTVVATGNPSPDLNQLFVDIQVEQYVGGAGNLQIGAGLFENVLSGIDSLKLFITQTVGISAIAPIISYQRYINTGDSRISGTAGLVINGLQQTSTGVLSVDNNYQLLINSSQQFASTSIVSNRWGIYQAGANDVNYLNANTIIGSSTPIDNGYKLQVNDKAYIDYCVIGQVGYGTQYIAFSHVNRNTTASYSILSAANGETYINSSAGQAILFRVGNSDQGRFSSTGAFLLSSSTSNPNNVKLKVDGNIEITTTTATGVHTPTAQHLPIYVNNVLYYLQLLN